MHAFAELHRDVVFGRSGGRIIFQPRIGAWYTDRVFAGTPLPSPYTGLSRFELYRALGCSARLYEFGDCFRRVEDPRVRRTETPLSNTDTLITTETPVGRQTEVLRRTPTSPRPRRLKWQIASEEEMRVAIWREERASFSWDHARYERLLAETGDLGAPTMNTPRHNVQDLYLNTMGVASAVYALADYPDTCEAYFRACNDCQLRLLELIAASPIDIVNLGDNVHGKTLPPRMFAKYLLPVYQEHAAILHRAGKRVFSHWDGDVKPLLPLLRETGLDGVEAITPRPQGDVTLEEVRAALPEDMLLMDGIPAILFDRTFGLDQLLDCARRVIDLFAPRLVLGISDEISSNGEIDRLLPIRDMVEERNARA